MTTSAEEVKNVHREPHPFVSTPHLGQFVGRTVAFVGRISSVDEGSLDMKTHAGSEVKIQKYRNDVGLT